MILIALYGTKEDHKLCLPLFHELPELTYRQYKVITFDCYDAFIEDIAKTKYTMIIVVCDGAAGMEAVIAAKNIAPKTSIIWFTNDTDFGTQSYRLGCTYFDVKPLTHRKLSSALRLHGNRRTSNWNEKDIII